MVLISREERGGRGRYGHLLLDVARVIDFLLRERFLGAEDKEDEDD